MQGRFFQTIQPEETARFEGGRMATNRLPRPPDPQEAKKSPWAKQGRIRPQIQCVRARFQRTCSSVRPLHSSHEIRVADELQLPRGSRPVGEGSG